MTNSSTKNAVELEVKNFGPISKGKIDLRPLTVFIGQSNTGKSYLAILIYTLHRLFSERHLRHWYYYRLNTRTVKEELTQFYSNNYDQLQKYVESITKKISQSENVKIDIPKQLQHLIGQNFQSLSDQFGREIVRCFGFDNIDAAIRKGSTKQANISIRVTNDSENLAVEHRAVISAKKAELRSTIPDRLYLPNDARGIERMMHRMQEVVHDTDEDEIDYSIRDFIRTFRSLFREQLTGPFSRSAYYLPADRTGVMHAHNVVVNALIENATMAGLKPATASPMLSGVMADFLEQLISLNDRRFRYARVSHPRKRADGSIVSKLEQNILRGTVAVKKSDGTNYPQFTYKPKGWKNDLPLMNASSMVSELSPVVLYLKHLVSPEQIMIIEEPESHLHPAIQVEFTRQIAQIVKSGIRVIITTHSEWVLEELANIVRRSELHRTKRYKSSSEDVFLKTEDVGAWLFTPKRRPVGSVISEIKLDDSGLFPSGFDEVAIQLHNNWADISERLEENS